MNFKHRIRQLQEAIKELSCDGLIVDDPINLYYLTGLHLSLGVLLVSVKESFLLVDGRYFENCKNNSPVPVLLTDQHHNTLAKLLSDQCSGMQRLGFSAENTTYKAFQDLQKCMHAIALSKTALVPVSDPVKRLRMIKDSDEIQLLRDAAALGSAGYDFACSLLKEGIAEIEIAIELEIFWKRKGSQGLAFDPIIAFGANSSMPHYRAGQARLKTGDCVLIDIGVNWQHYHSDMTRTLFFGEGDVRIIEIYSIVKAAQQAALDLCRPGTLVGNLDAAARELIHAKGYGAHFTHSLGHGVGLEIHEGPTLRNSLPYKEQSLQEGMVITIEPGIYLPGIGGVRLEDTVVITDKGCENLTKRSL